MPSTRSGKQSTPTTSRPFSRRTKEDALSDDRPIDDDDTMRKEPAKPDDVVVIEEQEAMQLPSLIPHCQELADKYIFDILDYIAEQILQNRQNRIFRYEVFTKFWHNHYPYLQKTFGRLYVRKLLCSILADVCSIENTTTDVSTWKVDAWKDFQKELQMARDACIRKDCRVFREMTSDTQPDEEPAEYENERWFTKTFDNIMLLCRIHEFVAPIRRQCSKQIEEHDSTDSLRMCLEDESALVKEMDKNDYDAVRKYLATLFVEPKTLPTHLKGVNELQKVLSNGPFSLDHLKKRMEKLIHQWNKICFGSEKSVLYHRGYDPGNLYPQKKHAPGSPGNVVSSYRLGSGLSSPEYQKAQKQRSSKKMKSPSKRLAEQSVVPENQIDQNQQHEGTGDIIPAETEENKQESTSPVARKNKRKSTHDELSDDEYDEPIRLSKVPKRRKSKGIPANAYQPDPGRFDPSGRVTRKIPYDEEEDNAILAGIKDPNLGVGKWAQIKEHFGEILRNRSSVMIKDRYRVLLAKGRIHLSHENEQQMEEIDSSSSSGGESDDDDIILNV